MRRIDNPLTTEGKNSKNKNPRRGKSFGYQVLGFGAGGSGSPFIVATGGSITTDGCFKIHTFNSPGTFCVVAGTCVSNNSVAYMVVAGGGAGGMGTGGGGGAGGFREGKTNPLVPYTGSPLAAACGITVTTQGYPIAVGAGGTGGCTSQAAPNLNGAVSTFSTITSAGGGGGSSYSCHATGGSGGSGGGGGYTWAGVHVSIPAPNAFKGAGDTPDVTPNQGFPGGKGWDAWYSGILTGGGGGATEAGVCATSSPSSPPASGQSGRGGAGTTSSISGSPVAFSGGGGGAGYGIHLGGFPGGAANGAASPCGTGKAAGGYPAGSNDGTTNRGGGAGGGASGGPGPEPISDNGGAGGSGVVVMRYKYQ
tara:strand:+ start:339 stop:1433 length:1095 start_codon:yes stop_codon:yes gene_type:complete